MRGLSLRKCALHAYGPSLSSLKFQMASLVTAERLELAYSVVETGLILLETPWTSALGNTSLKRFKASQQPPRYLIDIKERSNLVRTRFSNERGHLHLYILTVGVALVEIALLTVIRDLRPSRSGVEFLVKDSDGDLQGILPAWSTKNLEFPTLKPWNAGNERGRWLIFSSSFFKFSLGEGLDSEGRGGTKRRRVALAFYFLRVGVERDH